MNDSLEKEYRKWADNFKLSPSGAALENFTQELEKSPSSWWPYLAYAAVFAGLILGLWFLWPDTPPAYEISAYAPEEEIKVLDHSIYQKYEFLERPNSSLEIKNKRISENQTNDENIEIKAGKYSLITSPSSAPGAVEIRFKNGNLFLIYNKKPVHLHRDSDGIFKSDFKVLQIIRYDDVIEVRGLADDTVHYEWISPNN